jgi:hypothetical protein
MELCSDRKPHRAVIAGKTRRQYFRDYYLANRDEIVRRLRERTHAKAAKTRDQVEAAFTGRRFGALVTLYPLVRSQKHLGGWWLCRCDCGGEIEAWTYKLKRGVKTSCGCHIHARAKRAAH